MNVLGRIFLYSRKDLKMERQSFLQDVEEIMYFKGAYWISLSSFSITPPLVIALPTLRWQSCRSYSLLKAIAKSKGKIIAPSRS